MGVTFATGRSLVAIHMHKLPTGRAPYASPGVALVPAVQPSRAASQQRGAGAVLQQAGVQLRGAQPTVLKYLLVGDVCLLR